MCCNIINNRCSKDTIIRQSTHKHDLESCEYTSMIPMTSTLTLQVVLVCAIMIAVQGLSSQSRSSSLASNVWTESAARLTKELTISERAKLPADNEGIGARPTKIYAERLNHPASSKIEELVAKESRWPVDKDCAVTKIVHFQRHGQGYHNLMGDILRDVGIQPDIDSQDPAVNPWIRPEIVDSPLTETGKWQCSIQRGVASNLNPELVVVSPLLRAIQTAKLSFIDYYGNPNIPWIAHEGCREETGVLTCNRRRTLSEIQADFPGLTFHPSMTEDDGLWNANERESNQSKSDRIYDFLTNFIATRSEYNIAVVGHSAWLFHLCNVVVDCGEDEDLTSWFSTSEIRSMKLTFVREDSS